MAKFVSVEVTPVCSTGPMVQGVIAFNPIEIKGVVPSHGGSALLKSVTYIDLDDLANACTLVFFRKGTHDIGTLGAAPSINDARLLENGFIGDVNIPAPVTKTHGDFTNSYSQSVNNIDLVIDTADGSNSIYMAGLANGAGTHSADGLRIRLGFEVN
jgi:hypothetical protein